MLQAIRSFVAELADGDREVRALDDNDYRVAAAALLIHAASIDGSFSEAERDRMRTLLKQRFELDNAEANELIEQATLAEREAIDLYRFTRLLNRSLDEHQRHRMVEMMWEIAYADGAVTEFEDNLIWRAADLLGVLTHERVALRQRVKRARQGDRS